MPRGGLRVGSGRPAGSKSVQSAPRPQSAPPPLGPSAISGIEYLRRVVNDPDADPLRRDRAAAVLGSIEFRSGLVPVGKKAQAEENARLAGYGTSWWGLLHDQDAPGFDPDGLPPAERAKWDAEQQSKRAKQDKPPQDEAARWNRYLSDDPPPKPEEPSARHRSWDDISQGRYDPPQKPEDGDWGSDLD